MQPFVISDSSKQLIGQYPSANVVASAARSITEGETNGFLRLWISEGIPFAFKDVPMLYEAIREWVGLQLDIHPKMITIVGSGRIGYSLEKHPKFGKAFGPESDLDFTVISGTVFDRLCEAFYRWREDVATNQVQPRKERERKHWQENIKQLPNNIGRGFVDPHKIPTFDRYPAVQQIQNTKWLLGEKLAVTRSARRVRTLSFRVYRGWNDLMRQMQLNIYSAFQSLP